MEYHRKKYLSKEFATDLRGPVQNMLHPLCILLRFPDQEGQVGTSYGPNRSMPSGV